VEEQLRLVERPVWVAPGALVGRAATMPLARHRPSARSPGTGIVGQTRSTRRARMRSATWAAMKVPSGCATTTASRAPRAAATTTST
jgi:hypothetical protein